MAAEAEEEAAAAGAGDAARLGRKVADRPDMKLNAIVFGVSVGGLARQKQGIRAIAKAVVTSNPQ
jgi:hypothetical protein